jgi:TfoX/Sxy family transcriptional regulator of competence genes
MADNKKLADRIREVLGNKPAVREVKMFGGLSFMVNGSMVVSAGGDGDLLVRADPARADELLRAKGARPAEMGAGRAMGNSWISVAQEAIASEEGFDFWLDVALEYNEKQAAARGRGSQRKGTR